MKKPVKKTSLLSRVTLSYVCLILFLVVAITVLSNVVLEKQFQNYIMDQQEARNKETVALINQLFQNKGWDVSSIESIGMSALTQGIIVKVMDNSGQTIWDATVHNSGMCVAILEHMARNTSKHYPGFKGGYVESSYPLTHNFARIGTVNIGYYGPYYFNDNDLAFIKTLNKLLLGIGIIALLLALVLGYYMANRLSTPISKVIQSARQISKGNFTERILENTNTRELGLLTTAINELAENLERQEGLRKRLTADVAHELRTPLATLQSHLEAMIDGIWQPSKERLVSCHEEIMRLSRMASDLEKLAKVESENLILHKTEFDLSALVKQILQNFQPSFLDKNIEVRFRGDAQVIRADRDKMSQVMVNLFANALEYTPEGGRVEIEISGSERQAEIRVQNSGSGIPPEALANIFERFYRVDPSRSRLTGGSGIGLAIVKAIVEAHQGRISVRSEPGKETEFTVVIPK